MTPAETSATNAEYNKTAAKVAEALYQARLAARRQNEPVDRKIESLFPAHNRAGLGVTLEYTRMGNTPVSAGLQARARDLGVEFEHLGITLGTVIHYVDLREPISGALVQFLRDTLLERKVIFFRDQHLTEDEQVAFARKFGNLDAFPFGKSGTNPHVLEIRHGKDNPGTENSWHTDVTWMERPSLGSIAQCVEVPPSGGDTLFSDSHACYLGLADDLQQRLQHLWGINDYRIFLLTPGLDQELIAAIKREIPFGARHPLLRTHPETGKTALYIHGGFLRHDSLYDVRTGVTLDPADAREIVRMLLLQHAKPEYLCRFKWTRGSIAFWDNRAVQHYAASDYYPHQRLLRRVTVSGDTPFYDPTSSAATTFQAQYG
jgi:taurine dioxygenase